MYLQTSLKSTPHPVDQDSASQVTGEGPPCTDVGNAQRFARQHAQNLKYVIEWGKWICYDEESGHWQLDNSGEVMRRAKHTVLSIHREAERSRDKFAELTNHALRSQSAGQGSLMTASLLGQWKR